MTKKKNPFGTFQDDTEYNFEGAGGKWAYDGMGYSFTDGSWYIDEEPVSGPLTVVILAVRRCKEVTDGEGVTHRYPIFTRKADMVPGETSERFQALLRIPERDTDDKKGYFIFGSRQYNGRVSFFNPPNGKYRNEDYDTGIWFQLKDMVNQVADEYDMNIPHYGFFVEIAPEKKLYKAVAQNGKSSKIHRLLPTSEFTVEAAPAMYVGDDLALELQTFMKDEDIEGWANEWLEVSEESPEEAEEWTDDGVDL